MSCDFSARCVASGKPVQNCESISKIRMEIQKKIWTSRYNEMGSGPLGKSQVILVSKGNKQLTPPPPHWKKLDPHLEPRKMIVFFESNHLTFVKQVGE